MLNPYAVYLSKFYLHNSPALDVPAAALTEEAICSMLLESEIEKPDWVQIAKGLGFQLHDQPSSNSFLNEWKTFANYSMLSWENLARAFKKMKAKDSSVRKIHDRTGMVMMN